MKRNRDHSLLQRRSVLGGLLAAAFAALFRRREPKARKANPRAPERTRWIGHY